jgi:hypothetical protein
MNDSPGCDAAMLPLYDAVTSLSEAFRRAIVTSDPSRLEKYPLGVKYANQAKITYLTPRTIDPNFSDRNGQGADLRSTKPDAIFASAFGKITRFFAVLFGAYDPISS